MKLQSEPPEVVVKAIDANLGPPYLRLECWLVEQNRGWASASTRVLVEDGNELVQLLKFSALQRKGDDIITAATAAAALITHIHSSSNHQKHTGD